MSSSSKQIILSLLMPRYLTLKITSTFRQIKVPSDRRDFKQKGRPE